MLDKPTLIQDGPFAGLIRNGYAALLADPPWRFETWSDNGKDRSADNHYRTMTPEQIKNLPVADLAAPDCVLFMWATWPMLTHALATIEAWDFTYKTGGFDWMKADVSTLDLFSAPVDADMGQGYWTRSNSEPCLLATKGSPTRINADVRMGIIEPRREHSRKPDCVHSRIERLVAGPFIELFARNQTTGWTAWGNETAKFNKITSSPVRISIEKKRPG